MKTYDQIGTNHTSSSPSLIFDRLKSHEQVIFCNDEEVGLRAIIAIHDTTAGPALGGCRMRPYASEEEALEDVLRLSRGMTYKCAAADVDFGGGKAVIIGDPHKDKSPELFRRFGQFVQSLAGRFYTGCDMGTLPEDFVHAMKETSYIVGGPEEYGGSGDSSVPTAYGVVQGLRAIGQFLWQSSELGNHSFSVQGLGKVGYKVAETLVKEGARVFVTDIYDESIERLLEETRAASGEVVKVSSEEIYAVEADVFVPCAIGGVISDATIPQLRVKAICGAANNQLLDEEAHGQQLQSKGILYAPDYIVNAGGLIQVSDELYGSHKGRVLQKTKAIYDILLQIFHNADQQAVTTLTAANAIVEERLEKRRALNSFFSHQRRPKWDVRF